MNPTPEEAEFLGRMFNWKFHSAEATMPSDLDDDRQNVVLALSGVFGNCGWFNGTMGDIVTAAVAWVVRDMGES